MTVIYDAGHGPGCLDCQAGTMHDGPRTRRGPRAEHSATCYDCSFQSAWVGQRAEADDARIVHEDDTGGAHKIRVISRAAR